MNQKELIECLEKLLILLKNNDNFLNSESYRFFSDYSNKTNIHDTNIRNINNEIFKNRIKYFNNWFFLVLKALLVMLNCILVCSLFSFSVLAVNSCFIVSLILGSSFSFFSCLKLKQIKKAIKKLDYEKKHKTKLLHNEKKQYEAKELLLNKKIKINNEIVNEVMNLKNEIILKEVNISEKKMCLDSIIKSDKCKTLDFKLNDY